MSPIRRSRSSSCAAPAGKLLSRAPISRVSRRRAPTPKPRGWRQTSAELRQKLLDLEKPLIPVIYGCCLGGGLGVALNADLRFASSDAQVGIPAAVRGPAYGLDGLKQLVDLVGPSVAKDIMFSARRLQSDEALRIGLVNHVVDAEELEDVTITYAQTLATNAPLSIRASKFFIDQLGLERSQRDEARMDAMQREAANSEDFKE